LGFFLSAFRPKNVPSKQIPAYGGIDEKGVQVMTETGTMSAKGSIVTDCGSLLYTWVTKEIFFTLVKLLKIENTFSFQLDVADQPFRLCKVFLSV
jgi:hypothetical protein